MSRVAIFLRSSDNSTHLVRSILKEDIELLRQWKNSFKERFFFQQVISPSMQERWYESYLQRADDFMFIIVAGDVKVGCLGFRRLDRRIDLYNLMIGERAYSGSGAMSIALDLVCGEARRLYPDLPVEVSVLRTNPDLPWYLRRGFTVISEADEFVVARYPERPKENK